MRALRSARLNVLIFVSASLILFTQASSAQVPSSFVYQGQILKNGSTPLEANPVTFRVQILSQVNECVLYEEQHSINMLGSEGVFSLNIGVGIRAGADFEDTSSLENIFRNNQNITGITTCAVGNSYNAVSGHTRKMRISYNDGSGFVTLAQDFHMQATPFSWYANSLQGLTPTNFVQVNPSQNLTQSNLETLFGGTNYTGLLALLAGTSPLYMAQGTNGANLPSFATNPPAPAAGAMWFDSTTNQVKFFDGSTAQVMGGGGAGTGTVTSVATGSGLTGGPITSTGTISIATGGVTNTHLASGIDASKITVGTLSVGVVPTNTDTTKLPLAGGTMTGSIVMGASTNFSGFDLLSTGHMTMSPQRTLRLGNYTTPQQNDLITLTPLGPGHVGTTWYNSTTNKLMYWNGTTALEILDTAGTIGDITAVNTNTGSGLSGGVATGAATLQVVTDNTSIEVNGANQLQLKDLAVTNAKLASDAVTSNKILDGAIATQDIADSAITNQKINTVSPTKIVSAPAEYLTYEPAATACAAGQTLKWSATLPTGWICGNDDNTNIITSVFTRTGAITAQSGDYTASQITNTASGNVGSTNTQAAINELDSEKVSKAGDTISGPLILNGTLTTNAVVTSTSTVTLNAQNELRFADSDSSNFVALRAPATVASNITWTLPSADGLNGTVLTTNGSGALSWSSPSGATSVNASTGTAGSPSISFTTEADTGFYNSGSNSIGVASGGFQTFEFNSTGLQSPNTGGPLIATATGSATNPTYSFNGDPNTGWFSPAADTLAAATNSTERVRIDSSGNVGIGTMSPAARLDVQGEIKVGNTSSTCNVTNEGQQRYNSTLKAMEFCNGTTWREIGQPPGALCGKANYNLSNGWSTSINCKGFDPSSSCPSTYNRTGIIQNGGGDIAYFCVKN